MSRNSGATVELIYDSNDNGNVDYDEDLSYDYGSSYENASISNILGAGTYFIKVSRSYGSTNYTLGLSAIATPPTTARDPGSTMATALDIGVLSGSLSFSDFVGSSDRDDFYRFTLANFFNNFNLSLTGLSDSAKVELIYDSNRNGQFDDYDSIIDDDYGSSSYNPSISSPLGQATYFVRVRTYSSNDNTRYSLWLSA